MNQNEPPDMHPDLRLFIDRVIVPALAERWLREQALNDQIEANRAALQRLKGLHDDSSE